MWISFYYQLLLYESKFYLMGGQKKGLYKYVDSLRESLIKV